MKGGKDNVCFSWNEFSLDIQYWRVLGEVGAIPKWETFLAQNTLFQLLFFQGVGFTFEPRHWLVSVPGSATYLVFSVFHSWDSVQVWSGLLGWGVYAVNRCPVVISCVCICF